MNIIQHSHSPSASTLTPTFPAFFFREPFFHKHYMLVFFKEMTKNKHIPDDSLDDLLSVLFGKNKNLRSPLNSKWRGGVFTFLLKYIYIYVLTQLCSVSTGLHSWRQHVQWQQEWFHILTGVYRRGKDQDNLS